MKTIKAVCENCGHEWTFDIAEFVADLVDERGFPNQCPACGDPDHMDF